MTHAVHSLSRLRFAKIVFTGTLRKVALSMTLIFGFCDNHLRSNRLLGTKGTTHLRRTRLSPCQARYHVMHQIHVSRPTSSFLRPTYPPFRGDATKLKEDFLYTSVQCAYSRACPEMMTSCQSLVICREPSVVGGMFPNVHCSSRCHQSHSVLRLELQ